MRANQSNDAEQLASLEQRARELFEAQADPLAAPWERQWEPTKQYWRGKAAAPSAQPRVTPEHWIEIGKAQALAEFTEQRAAERRELLAAPQPREVRGAVRLTEVQARLTLDVAEEWLALFHETPGLEKYEKYNYVPAVELLRDELKNLLATTPQDAAGVEVKPTLFRVVDPDGNSMGWFDIFPGFAEKPMVEGCRYEYAYTTPPPGVDVGKLRELAVRVATHCEGEAEWHKAMNEKYDWDTEHASWESRNRIDAVDLRDFIAAIDAAAPGTGKDSLQVGGAGLGVGNG